MPQVMMPKKQDNGLGKVGMIGGGIAGGVFGGPMGAVAGAGAGQSAAGMLTPNTPGPQAVETAGGSAMSRRYQQMQDDPLLKLQESQQALSQLPPNLQQEYGPVINQAAQMERQKRGIA